MKNFIEVTDLSTYSKIAINVNYILAVTDEGPNCQILHIEFAPKRGNCFEVKETYSEVIILIAEALN